MADFKNKYHDKTKNKWEERKKFKAHPGKYTLLEMGEDEDDEADSSAQKVLSVTVSDTVDDIT